MPKKKSKSKKAEQIDLPIAAIEDASLSGETQRRYLNYALSVITSRALPDALANLDPDYRAGFVERLRRLGLFKR